MTRGEIYWADVVPRSGSEQTGRRPVIVMSHDGLPKASFAACHQVTTLDRAKLTRKAGTLPSEFLRRVEDALKAAMDLD